MMTQHGRILRVEDDGYVLVWGKMACLLAMPESALPDFYDPATIGCLLHLVQQHGDVPAHPDAESLVQALEAAND
jgi:hypothetical protein